MFLVVHEDLNHLHLTFEILSKERLFLNSKKCSFLETWVHFVGFVVSNQGLMVDPAKIETISHWPEPQLVIEIRSFLGLFAFYRWFIKGFSTIAAPMTDYISKDEFNWATAASRAFLALKEILSSAPILRLLDFSTVFKVACDTSSMGIGSTLSQEAHLVAYFRKKLNDVMQQYSTYDKEFYAIVQPLKQRRHYLLHKELILYSNHKPSHSWTPKKNLLLSMPNG